MEQWNNGFGEMGKSAVFLPTFQYSREFHPVGKEVIRWNRLFALFPETHRTIRKAVTVRNAPGTA
jgi:hypothetical protein